MEFEKVQNLLHSYLNEAIDNIEAGFEVDNGNEEDKLIVGIIGSGCSFYCSYQYQMI